jgi:hypothetical protein
MTPVLGVVFVHFKEDGWIEIWGMREFFGSHRPDTKKSTRDALG